MKADISDPEIKKICDVIGYPDKRDRLAFAYTIEALFWLAAMDRKRYRKFMYKALRFAREES
jgi:hypothetical protein